MNPFTGFQAMAYKETLHAVRDRFALFAAFMMPLFQLVVLGYAVDTNVRQVPTVVFDQSGLSAGDGQSGNSETRAFIDRLGNSDTFHVYRHVRSDDEMNAEMIAGRARVAVKFPPEFARNLLRGQSAEVLVLVDGSDSAVAGQAVTVSGQIALDESLRRLLGEHAPHPIDVRPKIMFNPASRSPNFFLPGMIAILLVFVTTMLTAFSVVREKERGTLEQLIVTPVRPLALMLGKITPYFVLGLSEMCALLLFMNFVFQVPIHGNAPLLILLSTCYLFVNLTIGILISTKAASQAEAIQLAMMIILPSVFLSGYIFPRDNMPAIFYGLSFLIPATYMVNISRGVILRGAGAAELWLDALVLLALGVIVLLLAARRFRRMIL
ncbi:MAG: ABC transporter permease [Gammaproteobacteria bacterium]|nr:ABC transporter permease [Gammaproteobacteria bacterium]